MAPVPIAVLRQALKPHVFKGSGYGMKRLALRPGSDWANYRVRLVRPDYRVEQPTGVCLAAASYMTCERSLHLL